MITFAPDMWLTFDNGRSIGTRGPEQGVIVMDEEQARRARITLERDGRRAPWTITCEIPGTFSHTAFASSEREARSTYSAMKRDLASMMEESDSAPCYEKIRLFMDVY